MYFLPPPWFSGGGRTHSLAGEGAGGANLDERTYTLVLYVSIIPLRIRRKFQTLCSYHWGSAVLPVIGDNSREAETDELQNEYGRTMDFPL